MSNYDRRAGFIGHEEVKVRSSGDYHRFDLYLDAPKDITYQNHDDCFIPRGINIADYVLYLLYDFELTRNPLFFRPSLVLYTDFYFKARYEGFVE